MRPGRGHALNNTGLELKDIPKAGYNRTGAGHYGTDTVGKLML